MRNVLIGQTDYSIVVRITGADGAPETGLAHTDIDIAYTRVETDNDVTTNDVTPADLASLTAAHSDWGWEEISSTDHPGLYRLDVADAVFASGAWEAVVTITDASGSDFYAHDIGFRLVNVDPQASVYPANVTQVGGDSQSATDLKDFADAGYDPSTNKVQGVVLVDTCTTNTDMRGTDSAATAAEMAKVPKSDGSVTWNATALASINTQADTALADYDGPTYTELLNFVRVMCRKDSAIGTDLLSVITAINADLASGSGAYTNTTEALEAIRDRGDAAWTTATGFSTLDAAGVRTAVGLGSANLDTQLDALPTNAELATALASADDAVLAAIAALNNLGLADIRTAVGLASANLDTQLDALPTNAELSTALAAADDAVLAAIAALNNLSSAQAESAAAAALTAYDPPTKAELDTGLDALPTAAENAAAILAAGDVDGYSLEETLKLCLAALAGKLSGAGTTTITIRAADDSKARITATVDADGNRSSLTLDETG